jgi:hypothetical protein
MAQVIKFYIPDRYKKSSRWIPHRPEGKAHKFPCTREEICLELTRQRWNKGPDGTRCPSGYLLPLSPPPRPSNRA